ncbi:MAG: CopG family transcriptional regulator [Thermoanaerobaculales bacterium]
MIRTQISLDPAMYETAREEARRRGVSFAELVRRALERMLATEGGDPPWARFAGVVEGGDADASRSVDSVVYGRDAP